MFGGFSVVGGNPAEIGDSKNCGRFDFESESNTPPPVDSRLSTHALHDTHKSISVPFLYIVFPHHSTVRPVTMFEAKILQGAILKKIIEAIRELVTDANLDCNERGITMQVGAER